MLKKLWISVVHEKNLSNNSCNVCWLCYKHLLFFIPFEHFFTFLHGAAVAAACSFLSQIMRNVGCALKRAMIDDNAWGCSTREENKRKKYYEIWWWQYWLFHIVKSSGVSPYFFLYDKNVKYFSVKWNEKNVKIEYATVNSDLRNKFNNRAWKVNFWCSFARRSFNSREICFPFYGTNLSLRIDSSERWGGRNPRRRKKAKRTSEWTRTVVSWNSNTNSGFNVWKL